MRPSLLNSAICLGAFLLGTIAAIVFFTFEPGDDALSQSRRRFESRSTNNAPAERRETDASKPILTGTEDRSKAIERKGRSPIIEIWKDLDGSVSISGKSLHFRMNDDGTVEFDYVLLKRTYTDGTVKFDYEYLKASKGPPYTKSVKPSLERTVLTKISDEEFNRFRSISEDLIKSENVKKEYKNVALIFDVATKLTINLKEKDASGRKITINDSSYDVMRSEYEKNFPKSVIDLIKEVNSVRADLIEKAGSEKPYP